MSDEKITNNPWIEFAREFAKARGITLGCAIKNKDARLEYNSKYKVKHSIKNVPKQLQKWVKHSVATAKKDKNNLSCCFSNPENQLDYRSGNLAVPAKKSPAKVASIPEMKEKLDGLYKELDDIQKKKVTGNIASVKANISRVEALLDEKMDAYLKNPTPDQETSRYKDLSAKKQKKVPLDYSIDDLEKLEDELSRTVTKYKKDKGLYSNQELDMLQQHAKMLRSQRIKIKNALYKKDVLERPVKKPRAKKMSGGNLVTDETARLGHPGDIEEHSLDRGSQQPLPPADYNHDFGEVVRVAKKSRKFTGFGMVSDARRGLMFDQDEQRLPM